MWEIIEKTVDRAVGGIVYSIWGAVGMATNYDSENKQVSLIVYDKSYKHDDKKEIVNKKFDFDLEFMGEIRAKDAVITTIEKYLIENYT